MAQTEHRPARLSRVDTIVDMDFHLTEKQDDLLPYLPEPWNKMFTRGISGDDYGVLSTLYPLPGSVNTVTTGKVQSESVSSREHVRQAMDELYLDTVLTTPTLNLLLGAVRNEEVAAALAHAFNEWQLDQITAADDGIYGTILIAPQNPQKAAEEIDDRSADGDMVGVFFPPTGVIPFAGDQKYDPIYDAAHRADLPIFFHNSASGLMSSFPNIFKFLNRYFSLHLVSHPVQHMCNLTDIMTKGIPERYPDLRFVFQEAGLGYVPFLIRRMDHHYHQNEEDVPLLKKLPSEYIDDQFFFTSQPVEGATDPEYVDAMVRLMNGEYNLLFSSDYPHFDFDHTSELMSLLSSFSDDDINNIYGQTALEVLNI